MGQRLNFARVDSTSATAAFDEHGAFVWRTLRYLGVEDAALEDAMQDVFVTAFRRADDFEGRSSMRTWLFGIARRIAFRYRRAASTRRRHLVADQRGAPEGQEDPHARADARRSVNQLIAGLDRDKRAVFVLCELEGMTAAEVAAALAIPIGTVHSRRRAAWQRLERAAAADRAQLSEAVARLSAQQPEPQQEQRMRAALIVALAVPAKTALWAVVGGVLLAGLVVTRIAVGRGHSDAPRASTTASLAPSNESPDRPSTRAAGIDAAGQTVESPSPSATATPRPAPATPRLVQARAEPIPHNARGAEPAPQDTLGVELALVSSAKQRLGSGQAEAALQALDDHARRFATGQLAAERNELRVEALCALERTDEANALARRTSAAAAEPCVRK